MGQEVGLSTEDVKKLLENPSAEARASVIEKVSKDYNNGNFTEQQLNLAEQIFRALMHDAEITVRAALASNLKDNSSVPHDIITDLVKDVDEVAIPVLQFSDVLTDEDLIEIIQSTDSSSKLLAVTERDDVSEEVSDAIIETKNENVVSNLLGRAKASISEGSLGKVVDYFNGSDKVLEKLVERDKLPVNVTERLITVASESIKQHVLTRYGEKHPTLAKVLESSAKAAQIEFLGFSSKDEINNLVTEMERSSAIAQDIKAGSDKLTSVIETLEDEGRLSPISALCMGYQELFEVSLARVSKVPAANVHRLILDDDSGKGFKALYQKSGMPEEIYEAVWLVARVLKEMDMENPGKRQSSKEMISRILVRAEKEKKEIENLSYFISMIHQHAKLAEGK